MPRAAARYTTDGSRIRRTWNGKLPEEFSQQDMLSFLADNDLALHGQVTAKTIAAVRAAGYDYQGGTVITLPGKEEHSMTEQEMTSPAPEAPPMKLDVSVRAIEPKGNLMGFANVKFNDCFVVEDFKILQTDKGLFVGMPSKPDKSSRTGYRDTAKPITADFRKQLHGAILEAYSAEISRLQTVTQAQERPSIKEQLEAGAKQAAQEKAARPPKQRPAKGAER